MSRKVLYLLTKSPGESSVNLLPENPPAGEEISVILMQDGVFQRQVPTARVYALSDDAVSRSEGSLFPPVSYQDVLRMMFEADGVVVL